MVTCKLCDAVLKKNAKYFCSHECANEYRIKIKSDELISNLLDGKNIRVTNGKVLKKSLIKYYGHRCSICKNTEWLNEPIPLIMDHIDGRSNNNTLNNLRLVCGNCDMKLPTYKSKNKNSDRKFRKKYYT